jgi:hypothetical protein
MMGHKDKLKTGMEVDVIYARKWYCYLINNTKLIRFVKKSINRRNRRKSKLELQKFNKGCKDGLCGRSASVNDKDY